MYTNEIKFKLSESSARRRNHMNNQALFSTKDKSKKLKCRLLQVLFSTLRVNSNYSSARACCDLSRCGWRLFGIFLIYHCSIFSPCLFGRQPNMIEILSQKTVNSQNIQPTNVLRPLLGTTPNRCCLPSIHKEC